MLDNGLVRCAAIPEGVFWRAIDLMSNQQESALRLPRAIEVRRPSPGVSHVAEEVVSLFDQLRNHLLRYILSFGLPVQDGEDIIQEVFLALFRHLQLGRSRANLRSWVFRVAHNLALKRCSHARVSLPAGADDVAALAAVLPDPNPNPEEQMASSQKRDRLLSVLSALPEQDRHCLVLRAEGLRYREIADVLDVSLGSVALSLGRSLTRLSRAIER